MRGNPLYHEGEIFFTLEKYFTIGGLFMNKQEFAVWAKDHIIYLDGATGSNLMKAGMPAGVCPEQWILEHKDIFIELQRAYAEAGSNIVYTPTFTANRIKLAEYGLEASLDDMTKELVGLSKQAVGEQVLVAGDITMTGEQLVPIGKMELETLIDVYKEQIRSLEKAGVDLLVVETMMSLQETRAAVIAAKEVCELPVIVTLTFEADGRTLFGTDARTAAIVLEALGVSAIGANCSTGPDKMVDVIQGMAEVTNIPIIAKPNAGLPAIDTNGNTYYDMDAVTFVKEMNVLIEAGASVIGGCCGTTPEYIKLLKDTYGDKRTQTTNNGVKKQGYRYLTSERKTVAFTLNEKFIVVGERINPTGKKKFQESLREGSMDMVLQFAEEQELGGADILDVNMGMAGIDEKAMMLQAINEIATVTNLPLSIDSSHVDVIEAALRNYPGRALINSISLEEEKFSNLLPIAKKYGAMFILLPLSDKGLPENQAEKTEIINKICERAYSLGMNKEDIIVDGLVNTVGANKDAALQTLETIRFCKEAGLATTCGLSNISFGMPERGMVNTAFLTLAISAGLTMAIANPSQELLMACAFATDLLLNKDNADMRYIEYAGLIKTKRELIESALVGQNTNQVSIADIVKGKTEQGQSTELGIGFRIRESVLKGNKKGIVELTKQALENGEDAKTLLDEVLLPAINEVGDFFDKGKYFLPQLIASAEAMKLSIEVLEPHLMKNKTEVEMPTIIIATVEGDIHDIGKNLVALMLKNYGFNVIDLGKDVSKETIIEAAREHQAQVIALSALMTTTMKQMEAVINYAKECNITAKIIIGGAVITQDYADEIGADGYSKDAADAVKLAKRLLGLLNS